MTQHMTGDTSHVFAESVCRLREAKGWNQQDLARRLQAAGLTTFHQTTVSRIEKGDRPVRLGEAFTLAEVLDGDVFLMSHPVGPQKPPKPVEPTGLGAVVEDSHGVRWVRLDDDGDVNKHWRQADLGAVMRHWKIVDAVRVLSPGVES